MSSYDTQTSLHSRAQVTHTTHKTDALSTLAEAMGSKPCKTLLELLVVKAAASGGVGTALG